MLPVRYLNEGLKPLVVLLELFEEADRFVVTTAEVAVHLLHFVFILIRKLQTKNTHPVNHTLTGCPSIAAE